MKTILKSAVLLSTLSSLSFAAPAPAQPQSCPSVSALQSVGISTMEKVGKHWYASVKSANYATNEQWTFTIGVFRAKHEEGARNKAMQALAALTLLEGPTPFNFEGQDSWVCSYTDNSGHMAGTVTPSLIFGAQLLKFIK